MPGKLGKIVWRVRAPDGAPHASAFDALVLPTDVGDVAQWTHPRRLLAVPVPHEGELPDSPLTLVVRARADAGPLVVECEAVGPDGVRQVYGRASEPLAVIVRSTTGILVTGLPAASAEPLAPAT